MNMEMLVKGWNQMQEEIMINPASYRLNNGGNKVYFETRKIDSKVGDTTPAFEPFSSLTIGDSDDFKKLHELANRIKIQFSATRKKRRKELRQAQKNSLA